MKEKIISHMVITVTKRKKIVFLVTLLLCILSILSLLFLMKYDISFKGLAGDNIEEVRNLERVVSEFNVSGMTSITVQPNEDIENKVKQHYNNINKLIYNSINEEVKDKVLSILNDYIVNDFNYYMDKEGIINIVMEMLQRIEKTERKKLISSMNFFEEEKKSLIINRINGKDDTLEKIKRLFEYLNKNKLQPFIEYILNELDTAQKNDIVKVILSNMNFRIKVNFIEDLDELGEDEKYDLIDQIEKEFFKADIILEEFKNKSETFAYELKQILLSDKEAVISSELEEAENALDEFKIRAEKVTQQFKQNMRNLVNKNPEKKDKLNDLVRGVLYSDQISVSEDRLMYMLIVLPKRDISSVSESRIFANAVDNELEVFKEKYSGELIIRRTGYAVLAVDQEETMLDGFGLMMVITIIGIFLISFIGLKRLIYPILSFIPLIIGILLMFGFYAFTIGTINIITLITPILLFGVGIDYAIHFGARYGEVRAELGKEASQEDVLRETFDSIGLGLLIASMTTVLSLLSLLSATIGGLVDFSIMCASGVAFAFLSIMYILPILILWRERKLKHTHKEFLRSGKFTAMGKFAKSFIGTIISVLIIILSLTSIYFIPKLEVETEKDAMKVKGLESVETSKAIGKKFDFSYTQTSFIIKGYDNLLNFKKELKRIENGVSVYPTINTSRVTDASDAVMALRKVGWDMNIDTFEKYKKIFAEGTNLAGESNETLADVYEFFIRNYVDWENNEFLVLVSSKGYVWYEDVLENHIEDLKKLEKNTGETGAGLTKVWWFLISHMMWDLILFSVVAFIIIVIILAFTTKSLRGTIICSLSLIISIVTTLAIISMAGIKLTFMNIPGFPVIMGLGIDYTVHIYYRLIETNKDIVKVLSSTGKAVLLTTLTTLVAFGTVSFSVHPGIAEIGKVVFIGLSMSFLTSIFIIPLLVKTFYKKHLKEQEKNLIHKKNN